MFLRERERERQRARERGWDEGRETKRERAPRVNKGKNRWIYKTNKWMKSTAVLCNAVLPLPRGGGWGGGGSDYGTQRQIVLILLYRRPLAVSAAHATQGGKVSSKYLSFQKKKEGKRGRKRERGRKNEKVYCGIARRHFNTMTPC